jgi:SOS-response transcriptional repressor LexA
VRADVRDGLISRETAEHVYGVVLSGDDDPSIDQGATTALRKRLAAEPREKVVPTEPDAATWVKTNMRDGDEYLLNPMI